MLLQSHVDYFITHMGDYLSLRKVMQFMKPRTISIDDILCDYSLVQIISINIVNFRTPLTCARKFWYICFLFFLHVLKF